MKKDSIWKKLRIWAAFFVNPQRKYIILGPGEVWVSEVRTFKSSPYVKSITWARQESMVWDEKLLKKHT